jgi:hypothetical protein
MRTTIDIDAPILREVKAIHEQEGRSMGAVVSELLGARRSSFFARQTSVSLDVSAHEGAGRSCGQGCCLRIPRFERAVSYSLDVNVLL